MSTHCARLWIALAPLCTACTAEGDSAGTGADEAARAAVIASLAEHVTLGHYAQFSAQSAALAAATAALCEAPDAGRLEAAQAAWWAARAPWKQSEIVQFGPVVEYPERLGPKLDDWPVNADAVETLIASEDALEAASFAEKGSATRGLPMVEYLLWPSTTAPDVLAAMAEEPRRCAAAAGAAGDVQANAVLLEETWATDWMPGLAQPSAGDGDDYDSAQDVIDEWVNRMAFTAENIRATKLGKPVGDSAGGEPQPDTLESRPSGRSLQDARDALGGVQAVWDGELVGDSGDTDHPGIADLVGDDPALVSQIDDLLAACALRLAEVPEPLEQTIVLEPEVVSRAQEALQLLQIAIQVDLAQALGVTITFNDNDGD